MLARANRLRTAEDFRGTLRKGRRRAGTFTVVSTVTLPETSQQPTRFGFILSRRVGNAVVRNRVRRQLRAIAHELLPGLPPGLNIVIRVLPGAEAATWEDLRAEVISAIDRNRS